MRRLLAALALVAAPACVTNGGGGEGVALLGGLVIYSQVAKDAQNGELGAKQLWCASLEATKVQLDAWRDRTVSDDALVAAVTPTVHEFGRSAGFRLHPIQIKQLVVDARKVVETPEAYAQERKSCKII